MYTRKHNKTFKTLAKMKVIDDKVYINDGNRIFVLDNTRRNKCAVLVDMMIDYENETGSTLGLKRGNKN